MPESITGAAELVVDDEESALNPPVANYIVPAPAASDPPATPCGMTWVSGKVLGWQTPAEAFAKLLSETDATAGVIASTP